MNVRWTLKQRCVSAGNGHFILHAESLVTCTRERAFTKPAPGHMLKCVFNPLYFRNFKGHLFQNMQRVISAQKHRISVNPSKLAQIVFKISEIFDKSKPSLLSIDFYGICCKSSETGILRYFFNRQSVWEYVLLIRPWNLMQISLNFHDSLFQLVNFT